MILALVAILVTILVYYGVYKPLQFWKNRKVAYATPYPIFGNFLKSSFGLGNMCDELVNVYNSHPNNRCVGLYAVHIPHLMIRDPELLKEITIKKFDHFIDHVQNYLIEDVDLIFTKSLFALRGNQWRNMRATLSPAFTGSKMKIMFELVSDCGNQFVAHLLESYENQTTNEPLDVEMKELFSRYANDVIATAAFGIKCDSLKYKDNEFYKMGQEATDFKTWRFIGIQIFPFIMKMIGEGIIPACAYKYFKKLVGDALHIRRSEEIVRPDMIQLLLEAQKGTLKQEADSNNVENSENPEGGSDESFAEVTDVDIMAQAFIFLLAGFESLSAAISFMAYELAVNPDIQKLLQNEIDDVLADTNNITYEKLQKMKYIDMVFLETLRKWPTAPNTDRLCTKPLTITEHDGSEIYIEENMNLIIPIFPLHRDPNYFPNPDKFDPERFSDENKNQIKPFTYLPFGMGPRNCIGSRFAIMEAKLVFIHLLSVFDIVVTKKTDIPFVLLPSAVKVTAKNGFHLGLQKRNL